MTQLENRIIKILENENYKNKLIQILKQYKIKNITDELLIDTIMMNPSCLFRDITKINIDLSMLDFTECIKKYNLNDNIYVILNSIKRNGKNLELADAKLKNNYDVVLNAVKKDGLALAYASQKLKNNRKIVEAAINNNINSYYIASTTLKNDINIIKQLLILEPKKILEFDYLNNYTTIVKEVIKKNGLALKYSSLRKNKNVVTSACKNNIKALQYADNILLNDKTFLINLAKKLKNDNVIYYANSKLLLDKQFNIDIIKNLGFNLYFIDNKFKDDIEVVNAAVNKDIRYLEHASERIRKNEQYILELTKKYGPILRYAHSDLLNNKTFMYKAIKEYNGSIKYLKEPLLSDKEFINDIKSINKWCKNYLEH